MSVWETGLLSFRLLDCIKGCYMCLYVRNDYFLLSAGLWNQPYNFYPVEKSFQKKKKKDPRILFLISIIICSWFFFPTVSGKIFSLRGLNLREFAVKINTKPGDFINTFLLSGFVCLNQLYETSTVRTQLTSSGFWCVWLEQQSNEGVPPTGLRREFQLG